MIKCIFAHYINKEDAEEIVKQGFDYVIALSWSPEVYDYFKEHGVKVFRWIRDREVLSEKDIEFIKEYSYGAVLDPETKVWSPRYQEYYCDYLIELHRKVKIVGTCAWAYPLPIFKKLGTVLINKIFGININCAGVSVGSIYTDWGLCFPMCYPQRRFLADIRVRWMLEGWAKIKEDYTTNVFPILQAFSKAELNEGSDTWKPTKEQLSRWVEWVEELGFYGVSFFCWDTYKKSYI